MESTEGPDPHAFTAPFMLTKTMRREIYPAVDPSTNTSLSAKGKVVIVTGASGGIGFAIARAWALAGAKAVVLVGRRLEALEKAAKDLETTAATLLLTGDISALQDAEAIVKQAAAKFGRIDALVNAAGPMNVGPVGTIDPEAWWQNFEGGVRGKFNMIHAFIHATGGEGTVVNIASLGASFLMPGMSGYSSSMLAVVKLGECLDVEHPKLRVFTVHPGMVEAENGRGMVVDSLLPFSKDKAALTGGAYSLLGHAPRRLLAGWLEQHKDEITEKTLVKLGFLNAQLQVGGYPWSS
ncbi:hypothetical protein PG996_010470 [Apiospora saccharicola]|uniref:Ketoreductase domain-containing protein n=1 Tax=Apiospora saccharicola TaxID=335842 RepID=A0ABR1UNN6_9PEZI